MFFRSSTVSGIAISRLSDAMGKTAKYIFEREKFSVFAVTVTSSETISPPTSPRFLSLKSRLSAKPGIPVKTTISFEPSPRD